jgi:hypothetical protein
MTSITGTSTPPMTRRASRTRTAIATGASYTRTPIILIFTTGIHTRW